MKHLLAVALACLVVVSAVPGYAQEAAKPADKPADKPATVDVTGVWDITVETPNGAIQNVGTLKQEGEKLTGTMASQMGEVALVGTVVGDEIKYVITIDMQGQQMAINFAGKIEGDKMAGLFEFGGMGSAAWSAAKRKQ